MQSQMTNPPLPPNSNAKRKGKGKAGNGTTQGKGKGKCQGDKGNGKKGNTKAAKRASAQGAKPNEAINKAKGTRSFYEPFIRSFVGLISSSNVPLLISKRYQIIERKTYRVSVEEIASSLASSTLMITHVALFCLLAFNKANLDSRTSLELYLVKSHYQLFISERNLDQVMDFKFCLFSLFIIRNCHYH